MASLLAFCLLAVPFLCGNGAAEKKLAFVTVVSNMCLSDKPKARSLDGKKAATKLARLFVMLVELTAIQLYCKQRAEYICA